MVIKHYTIFLGDSVMSLQVQVKHFKRLLSNQGGIMTVSKALHFDSEFTWLIT